MTTRRPLQLAFSGYAYPEPHPTGYVQGYVQGDSRQIVKMPRAEMRPLLAALRASLPLPAGPAGASGCEGHALDWPLVSAGLRELRGSLEAELAALSAEAEAVDEQLIELIASPAVSREEEDAEACVERVESELKRAMPELSEAERHFGRVAALVRPSTTRLAQLEARAALFAAALEVEMRGRRAKQHAIEATPEALASFTAFSTFVHALPAAYTAVRVCAVHLWPPS